MTYENFEDYVPNGKEMIKLSKERQQFWINFICSTKCDYNEEVRKLRSVMNPGVKEDLINAEFLVNK